MHDEDVATTAKWWSPESVIHDRVFRQNASMCYDILLWVAVHSHFHRLAVVATTKNVLIGQESPIYQFGSSRNLVDARRGCSHRCQAVEPRISHP